MDNNTDNLKKTRYVHIRNKTRSKTKNSYLARIYLDTDPQAAEEVTISRNLFNETVESCFANEIQYCYYPKNLYVKKSMVL